jgi:hypothetical protein
VLVEVGDLDKIAEVSCVEIVDLWLVNKAGAGVVVVNTVFECTVVVMGEDIVDDEDVGLRLLFVSIGVKTVVKRTVSIGEDVVLAVVVKYKVVVEVEVVYSVVLVWSLKRVVEVVRVVVIGQKLVG